QDASVTPPRAVRDSPGRSAAQLLAAAALRRGEAPQWPQLPSERTILTYLGRHAAALACRRFGVGPGDEVLMPSYHCGVEVDAVLSTGATVVLYRVDGRLDVDVEHVALSISERTRAVYAIRSFDGARQLADLRALCRLHGIPLIEDCALALFASDDAG